jgi:peptide chain release factor subunit 1
MELMLRQVRSQGERVADSGEDLDRIEAFVRGGVERSHVRGLVMFSCVAHGLWRVFELPVPVRNQLVVNHAPSVRQLEHLVEEYERFAVLLVDKQRARLLVYELGELVDRSERFDELPRGFDDNRGHQWKTHQQSQLDEAALQHVRHAAQVTFDVYRDTGFHHLLVAATSELVGELERSLHPYLRERLGGRLHIPVTASEEEVRTEAHAAQDRVERAREAELVERLRDAAGAGTRGVLGLEAVLAAVVDRRVDQLVVSQGYTAPGWWCPSCTHLGLLGRECPSCGAEMRQLDDVVEEAMEEVLVQSGRVHIAVGNADLDVLGRIGALLRY